MKLLLFADLHLDTPFRWATPEVARRRRQALRDTLRTIAEVAVAERVDALCCAGDLYEHDMVAPDTAQVIGDVFGGLGRIPVLLAPGNHDWLGPASLYRQTSWPANVHLFDGARLQPWELADGFTVWGAAHHVPANTPGFLQDFRVDRGGTNVGLFHGSLRSGLALQGDGKQPHAPFEEHQIERSGLLHALVGHFHTPCEGEWHTYPGNPSPLSFGEGPGRGAVVVEFAPDGGVPARSWRTVTTAQAHDVTVDVQGAATLEEVRDRARVALAPLTGTARVSLTGEIDARVDVSAEDVRGVAPHLDGVVVRLGGLRHAYDVPTLREEPTVRGQFVRDVLASGLAEDQLDRVLVMGLRALDGRDDLDVPR